jgi:hypothetical protein
MAMQTSDASAGKSLSARVETDADPSSEHSLRRT